MRVLKYSPSVMQVVSFFYRHKTEVELFVEDKTSDKEFYRTLVSRLTDRKFEVFNLGPRATVVEECLKYDPDKNPKKRLYCIDGDLNLISDENPKRIRNLYVHDRYCIENFLIDFDSVVDYCHTHCGGKEPKRIQQELGLSNFFKINSEKLIELFLHYSLSHKNKTGEACTSVSVFSLVKEERVSGGKKCLVLDHDKVDSKIETHKNALESKIGNAKYLKQLSELKKKWKNSPDTAIQIVSGKDYLLPLICELFKKTGLSSYNKSALRLHLAKSCDVKSLARLKSAIEGI